MKRNLSIEFSYNKTENLTIDDLSHFDYLLVESNDSNDPRLLPYLAGKFQILDFVRAFNGFEIHKRFLLKMRYTPKIYILTRT